MGKIYKLLLHHSFLGFNRRSSLFMKLGYLAYFIRILVVLFLLVPVLLFLKHDIDRATVGGDSLLILNKLLLPYYLLQFYVQLLLQKRPEMNVKSYLSSGVKKATITCFIILQAFCNFYTVIGIGIVFLTAVFIVYPQVGVTAGILYFVTNMLITTIINSWVSIVKWINENNKIWIISTTIFLVILGIAMTNAKALPGLSSRLFSALNRYPLFLIPAVTLLFFSLNLYRWVIRRRLYVD